MLSIKIEDMESEKRISNEAESEEIDVEAVVKEIVKEGNFNFYRDNLPYSVAEKLFELNDVGFIRAFMWNQNKFKKEDFSKTIDLFVSSAYAGFVFVNFVNLIPDESLEFNEVYGNEGVPIWITKYLDKFKKEDRYMMMESFLDGNYPDNYGEAIVQLYLLTQEERDSLFKKFYNFAKIQHNSSENLKYQYLFLGNLTLFSKIEIDDYIGIMELGKDVKIMDEGSFLNETLRALDRVDTNERMKVVEYLIKNNLAHLLFNHLEKLSKEHVSEFLDMIGSIEEIDKKINIRDEILRNITRFSYFPDGFIENIIERSHLPNIIDNLVYLRNFETILILLKSISKDNLKYVVASYNYGSRILDNEEARLYLNEAILSRNWVNASCIQEIAKIFKLRIEIPKNITVAEIEKNAQIEKKKREESQERRELYEPFSLEKAIIEFYSSLGLFYELEDFKKAMEPSFRNPTGEELVFKEKIVLQDYLVEFKNTLTRNINRIREYLVRAVISELSHQDQVSNKYFARIPYEFSDVDDFISRATDEQIRSFLVSAQAAFSRPMWKRNYGGVLWKNISKVALDLWLEE
ncbi:MAG: hypothetical protein COU06_02605, partial [Candidatus Harrisonbacteria bacterium CG10_big_fil_rev_8_21_14_0_10_38_8]